MGKKGSARGECPMRDGILCQLRRFNLGVIQSRRAGHWRFLAKVSGCVLPLGANMTDVSSKIDVRRLKVGDLLTNVLVNCALLGLVFLVLGRDQRPSNGVILRGYNVCLFCDTHVLIMLLTDYH